MTYSIFQNSARFANMAEFNKQRERVFSCSAKPLGKRRYILSAVLFGGLAMSSVGGPVSADVMCRVGSIWCRVTAYPCDILEIPEGYVCYEHANMPDDRKVIDGPGAVADTVDVEVTREVEPKLREDAQIKPALGLTDQKAMIAETCPTCLPPDVEAPVIEVPLD